ncbi:MAG: preprotein translocase subunit Sec61beta [Nanoarchaeota archaeon]|nr:preprotein translocase subunit Sec61beta [Nanoarchaeota archaeon]MBU4086922.1 preprotein translocase subunit Sec61beta [Nanoarchaeota archaeon]
MANSGVNLPTGSGGLMRYNEEYESKLKLKPTHVIIYIIIVILFTLALNIFWPIRAAASFLGLL